VLRVTADTNVMISGLNFSGNPRRVLEIAEDGAIDLAVSDPILDEVEEVLRRDKFSWPEEEVDKAIRHISRFAKYVEPTLRIDVVKEDLTDNRIIECAAVPQAGGNPSSSAGRTIIELPTHSYSVFQWTT
jgi:putative PIN family toxin of toxin-antitoxin system